MKAEALVFDLDERTIILRRVVTSFEEYHNLRIEYPENRVGLQSYKDRAEQWREADCEEAGEKNHRKCLACCRPPFRAAYAKRSQAMR